MNTFTLIATILIPIVMFLQLGTLMMITIMNERIKRIMEIDDRLESIEEYLENLSEEVNQSFSPGPMFQSADGKFTATTMDELIQKMRDAGATNMEVRNSDDVDPIDMERLKNFFENLSESIDDDEEDEEEWKKKKGS